MKKASLGPKQRQPPWQTQEIPLQSQGHETGGRRHSGCEGLWPVVVTGCGWWR